MHVGEKPSRDESEVTEILAAWSAAGRGTGDRLMATVYDELRRLAVAQLRRERSDHTLQPTALVHEVYLKLLRQRRLGWRDRHHFFASVAQQMRRILVDHARRRLYAKLGGGAHKLALTEVPEPRVELRDEELVALDEALERLAGLDPSKARLVELRYFGGLSVAETASVLGISPATYHRHWHLARAWLHRELAPSPAAGDGRA